LGATKASGHRGQDTSVPKIPGINHQDAVRVFQRLGYRIARQSGHIIMTNGKTRLVIPRHDPVDAITMGNIAKAAGLSPDEFRKSL
jgi:predicted RNA binding protein YcfA (HicA-like mRNA interferase family)